MNSEFLINPKLSNKQIIDTFPESDQRTSKPKIDRILRWFEKEGDDLVGKKLLIISVLNFYKNCLELIQKIQYMIVILSNLPNRLIICKIYSISSWIQNLTIILLNAIASKESNL